MNESTLQDLNKELAKLYGMVNGYPRAVIVRFENDPSKIRIIENHLDTTQPSEALYNAVASKFDEANGTPIAWEKFNPSLKASSPKVAGDFA